MANKTVFLDSEHIVYVSTAGCTLWLLDQHLGEIIIQATDLTWLTTRSVYISKIRNLSNVSRINCSVGTIDGKHFQREIDVKMEDGAWRLSYNDIEVTVDVSRRQAQKTVGKRILSRRIRSENPQIRFDTIVSVIPANGDRTTAKKIKRWGRKFKVDYDVASGVYVTLRKRKFLEGAILNLGYVV